MRMFILTQDDPIYIPRMLDVFLSRLDAGRKVSGIAVLEGDTKAASIPRYVSLFGPVATAKMGVALCANRGGDYLGRMLGIPTSCSVPAVAARHGIPVHRPRNVNATGFLDTLRTERPDLVISIACPQIVKKRLLEIPRLGCINVHSALLPKYRGRFPSFWVLANGETETGVTVHYMNERLDDGAILVQKKVPIARSDTLHTLILKSKVDYAAGALLEAVDKLAAGDFSTMPNDAAAATYYSFPTPEAVRRFRESGRRVR